MKLFENISTYTHFSRPFYRSDIELFRARILKKTFPTHKHEGFVIGVIDDGMLFFKVNGLCHKVGVGYLTFLNPNELHSSSTNGAIYLEYQTLNIPVDIMENIAGSGFLFSQTVIFNPMLSIRLRQLLNCLSLNTAEDKWDAIISEIICAVSQNQKVNYQYLLHQSNEFESVLSYIDENPEDDLKLSDLANIMGLSKYHFLRKFYLCTGVTPVDYVRANRLQLAKIKLKNGESIVKSAISTGFTDQSHFTRWLKSCYGITPKKYQSLNSSK